MGKNKRKRNAEAVSAEKRYIGGEIMSESLQERVVKIKVIGVGGAGNNVINRMISVYSLTFCAISEPFLKPIPYSSLVRAIPALRFA